MTDSEVASESYVYYLTNWKIVGNSEVHTDPYLTSWKVSGNSQVQQYLTQWKVSGNSVVDNNTILSCGDLGQDGKYHVKISNGVNVYDIPLTEPLRKARSASDSIEFSNGTAIITRNIKSILIGNCTVAAQPTDTSKTCRWKIAGDAKPIPQSVAIIHNIISNKYNSVTANDTYLKVDGVSVDSNGRVLIFDTNFTATTDANNFKNANADVEVIYDVETPIVETIQIPNIAVSPTGTYTSANTTPYSAFTYANPLIYSCGDYSDVDGKYHVKISNGITIYDIPLTEPLRKVNNIADTIEFPVVLEAFCNTDGSQIQTTLPDDTILHIKQFVKNGDFSDGSTEWRNGTSQTSCDYSQNKAVISNRVVGHGYPFAVIQDIRSNIVIGNSYYFKYNAIPCKNIVLGADYSNRSTTRVSCIGNTNNIVSDVVIPASLNQLYLGYSPTTDYEVGDTTEVDNVVSFDLDVMFADCPSLKPTTASGFEALFTNINYIAYSDTVIDVIVKDGKLYKYVETEGKALVTRNIKKKVINPDEIKASDFGAYRLAVISDILSGDDDTIRTLNNLYADVSMNNRGPADVAPPRIYIQGNGVLIRGTEVQQQGGDVSIYKQEMIDFYANGGTFDVLYALATPTTELVDVSSFPVSPTDTYTSANVVPYSALEHTENKEIWSCGEYNPIDGKWHILVQPQGGSIADIALDEPLRKVGDVADTIEFPSSVEGKALVTRNIAELSVAGNVLSYRNTNREDEWRWNLGGSPKGSANSSTIGNIICSNYNSITSLQTFARTTGIGIEPNGVIVLFDKNFNQQTDKEALEAANANTKYIFELATPTTELVDAPQIEEADSYSMVISQGGKAVSWSSFETE